MHSSSRLKHRHGAKLLLNVIRGMRIGPFYLFPCEAYINHCGDDDDEYHNHESGADAFAWRRDHRELDARDANRGDS